MQLRSLILQNFRSYSQKKFDFDPQMTFIVGPNTAGKTNCIEAIMLLATGKSFRFGKDTEMISFGEGVGRVGGLLKDLEENFKLDVTLAYGSMTGGRFYEEICCQ